MGCCCWGRCCWGRCAALPTRAVQLSSERECPQQHPLPHCSTSPPLPDDANLRERGCRRYVTGVAVGDPRASQWTMTRGSAGRERCLHAVVGTRCARTGRLSEEQPLTTYLRPRTVV